MALGDDLVAAYDDGTTTDQTGNGYTLTNNNSVGTTTGKIGNGFDFNGSNQYLSSSSLSTDWLETFDDNDKTMCMWVNPDTVSSNGLWAVAGSGNTPQLEYMSILGGNMRSIVRDNSGGNAGISNTSHGMSAGTWCMITFRWDVSAGTNTVHINTSQHGTNTNGSMGAFSGFPDFIIGARNQNGSINTYYNGQADLIYLWDRLLSTSEISDMYNSGTGMSYTDIVPPVSSTFTPKVMMF